MIRRTLDTNEDGLTIVELMISVLLAGVLSSGLFYMFSGQSDTYDSQLKGLSTQQSAWGAMEFLQRQIRTAGYGFGGCRGGAMVMWDGGAGTTLAPFQGFRSYQTCNILKTDLASCPAAPLANTDGVDSFTVTFATQLPGSRLPAVRTTQAMLTSSAVLSVNSPGGFRQGDLVALWQPNSGKNCPIFKLTANPVALGGTAGYRLDHASDGQYNPPSGQNIFPPGGYGAGSLLINLSGSNATPRHFAIDDSKDLPRLVTWTTDNVNPRDDLGNLEVIADGVEDLQVAWACDVDADGVNTEGTTPALRKTDEWAGNVADETPPVCGTQAVNEVRISLIARGASATLSLKNGHRPALEDRPYGSPSDDLALSGNLGTFPRTKLSASIRPYNMAGAPR